MRPGARTARLGLLGGRWWSYCAMMLGAWMSCALLLCGWVLAPSEATTTHVGSVPYWTGMTHIGPQGFSSSSADYSTYHKKNAETAVSGKSNVWVTVYCDEGGTSSLDLSAPGGSIFVRRNTNTPPRWFEDRTRNNDGSTPIAKTIKLAFTTTSIHTGNIEPAIATDSDGTWVVIFSARTHHNNDYEIWVSRSTDDALTWSTPQALTSTTDNKSERSPRLTYEPASETWVVAWSSWQSTDGSGNDADVLVATSKDGFATFSTPAFVNTNFASDNFDNDAIQMFSPANGSVQIVYRGMSNGVERFFSVKRDFIAETPWTSEALFGPQTDDTESVQEIGVAADKARNVIVIAYTTSTSTIKASVSVDGGTTFSAPDILQSESDPRDPVVATDSRGIFVTAWSSTQGWYDETYPNQVRRPINAARDIFYSVSTGQNDTGIGKGWNTPKALDTTNVVYVGVSERPRIVVDAKHRHWVVHFQSTKTNYIQQNGLNFGQSSSNDASDSDIFFSFWFKYQKELCAERSFLISAHCVEALQERINALPENMTTFSEPILIGGAFRITSDRNEYMVISGGRKVSIAAEVPGTDSMNQGRGCFVTPFFYIDDENSGLRFDKTGFFIENSPILLVNRGGAPESNLEVTYDSASNWGTCHPFMAVNGCPVGFRPPNAELGESKCMPCPGGVSCVYPYLSTDPHRPCPAGHYCTPGSYQTKACAVYRYYSTSDQPMSSPANCSTLGTACSPGYRCPPAALPENHFQVIAVDRAYIEETLVFPSARRVEFTLKNVFDRQVYIGASGNYPPAWLDVGAFGGEWHPNSGQELFMRAELRSNVPGVSVNGQLETTYTFTFMNWEVDSNFPLAAPIVITFVRLVTSVIFSPEEGIKGRVALGDSSFSDNIFVFNIGCSDSVRFTATVWDCGHPNAPSIISSQGNAEDFPVDWLSVTEDTRNGSIEQSSATPSTITVVMDPTPSIITQGAVLNQRLPVDSDPTNNRFGREGIFLARACVQVEFIMEQQGIPMIKNVPVEVTMYENCPEGTFSPTGTSEQSTCSACPAGTYTNATGTRQCTACPESRPRSLDGAQSIEECLTAPGTLRDLDGSTLECTLLGEGVACNTEGMRLENVVLRPGYWRSDNHSKRIMRCLHPDFCVGGDGYSRRSAGSQNDRRRRLQATNGTEGVSNVDYCYVHHRGALCEGCVAGYVRRGSNYCSVCDAKALAADRLRLSWTIVAAVLIVVIAFIVVQRKMIFSMFRKAKKTANQIRRGSINAFSSNVKRTSNLGQSLSPKNKKAQAAVVDSTGSEAPATASSTPAIPDAESYSENKTVTRTSKDIQRQSKASVSFIEEDVDSSDNESSPSMARRSQSKGKTLGRLRPHSLGADSLRLDRSSVRHRVLSVSMRMSQRFQVKERASYMYRAITSIESNTTLRILLSLFQVCAGISTTFVELFPAIYHQTVAVLNIISAQIFYNIDFACVLTSNHYVSLILSIVVPFIAFLLIGIGHAVVEYRLKRQKALHELRKTRNASFSLFLLVLFLVYPGVSSTILSTFACRRFDDGSAYLRKDLTIDCNAEDRFKWLALAIFGTIVYVVGVPAIYLASVMRVKDSILDPDASPEDHESVMFLVDPYRRECYWFEVFELIRKLTQTSLLVFFLDGSVLQTIAMVVVSGCVIIVIYELKPYKLEQANRLASIAQWCILLIAFLAMLYKVDLVRLDSDFNYNRKLMLDVLVMIALFITPVVAIYQQRKFLVGLLSSQIDASDRFVRKHAPKVFKEKLGCCLDRPIKPGEDGKGVVINTSPNTY